jgi:hypothetical protein
MNRPKRTRTSAEQAEHHDALHRLADLWNTPGLSHVAASNAVAEEYTHERPASLRRQLQRHGGTIERTHGNQVFTDAEEDSIVGVMRAFSMANRGLSRLQVLSMVREEFNKGEDWEGEDWYDLFIKRHAAVLHGRIPQEISANRTAPERYEQIQQWVDQVGRFLGEHSFTAETIWGADETLLAIRSGRAGAIRLEAVGKVNCNYQFPRGTKYGSIIIFSNAAGHAPFAVVILPLSFQGETRRFADFYLPGDRMPVHSKMDVYFAFTEKGYMTNSLFKTIVVKFLEIVKSRHPDLENLLFLDRLGAHLQPGLVRLCLLQRLYHVWFPAHCSEFIQPADAEQFGVFHRVLNSVRTRYDGCSLLHAGPAHAMVLMFLNGALATCTRENVVWLSFASTGIFPWDPKLILTHAARFAAPAVAAATLSSLSAAEAHAEHMTTSILTAASTTKKPRRVHGSVEGGILYLGDQLLAADDKWKEEQRKAAEEKAQRQAERVTARQHKAEEKERHKRRRQEYRQQKEREKEELRRAREEARKMWSCSTCHALCSNRRSNRWAWCEYCDHYGACPNRDICPEGRVNLDEHEDEERQAGKLTLSELAERASFHSHK